MQLTESTHTNDLGMTFQRIEPGGFLMGNDRPLDDAVVRLGHWRYGDSDERPIHRVEITQAYYVATTPVTNTQFEQILPEHASLRGKAGFSTQDDEAAVFVSWHDAVRYCNALSERDGLPYRLPSEAEWEYACRAGTDSAYWTGDTLPDAFHNNQAVVWYPTIRDERVDHPVPLPVGVTPANPYGLMDLHGLVEEWCLDWYAAYEPHPRVDSMGPGGGDFRVTRGGSHSTELYYLRSANRSGAHPDERSWYVGFRPVIGPMPVPSKHIYAGAMPLHQRNVISTPPKPAGSPSAEPRFAGPLPYVTVPPNTFGPPFGEHNHDPGFAVCPNGDLLAIWYTCVEERGRELAIAASRRRFDHATGRLADAWDPPSMFWNTPDKNDHAPALWSDGSRMYHFNGMSGGATWGPLATILRTSDDSGATWSDARIIIPDHGPRHMPIAGVFALRDGAIVLPCDTPAGSKRNEPGTALWMSPDGGGTWAEAGGTIAGIHAGVVELADGSIFAFGRGTDIDGRMAQSVSSDRGATWDYSPSPFPGITSSQRIVLMRMRGACADGSDPILLVAFSNADIDAPEAQHVVDATGASRPIKGMYAAISFDDGATWPYIRPVSDDGPDRYIEGLDGRPHLTGRSHAEFNGYLAAAQRYDGNVHLISSRNEYVLNLAWLTERPPGVAQVERWAANEG